jgi:enoyl-CoA hydratase/carnithine racemase
MASTFALTKTSDSLWRVRFNNPPINLIDDAMISDLRELFAPIERSEGPVVVVFESADPDYFLAHFDVALETLVRVRALPPGSTGLSPWLDVLVRLSKLPAVTISAIRGRARGAGSEFVLATDIRFASRERAILAQIEVGFGAIPGGGPAARLPGLVGRGRTFEILLGGEDFDGELAERYGYVNRAIPDERFDDFVDRFANRVSNFDREALMDIKHFINQATLPSDEMFPPQQEAFVRGLGRPNSQVRLKKFLDRGLQQRSDVELRLGESIGGTHR